MQDMIRGKVKWFSEAKGFGCLQRDNGDNIFCYASAINGGSIKSLQEGDKVEFDVVNGPNGLLASNVRKV